MHRRPDGVPGTMETDPNTRRCTGCGARLASDNAELVCRPCQRAARAGGLSPPEVPPEFWDHGQLRDALTRERHIGHVVRSYRKHPFHGRRPIPQEVAARWLNISQAQLARIERGRPVTDLERLIQWAKTLRIPRELLWFSLPPDGAQTRTSLATAPTRALGTINSPLAFPAILPDLQQIELLRQEMSDVFQGAISDASLEEWERIAIRYARATRDRPAGILLGDISQDLTDLCRLIRNQRTESVTRRLTRVSAQMSGLMCLVFCLLDDRQSFRKWARTASLAGNEASDPETLSWVLAQEAYGHYYSGDISEALDVARHAYEVVQVPCTGAALASALEARAYAVTGRGAETRRALARAEEVLSHLDGESLVPSAFGYNEASFRFHEGNAYTHLRDFKSAMRAQARALDLCAPDNYADWAMTRLDRAQCLIYSGDITTGLQYASETITMITPAQRRGIITLRGQDIVETLPECERELPAAREFRELLVASTHDNEVESS
jgi:tetratricopeptide (TPR) repeat protein